MLIACSHLLDLNISEKSYLSWNKAVFLIFNAKLSVAILSEGEDRSSVRHFEMASILRRKGVRMHSTLLNYLQVSGHQEMRSDDLLDDETTSMMMWGSSHEVFLA